MPQLHLLGTGAAVSDPHRTTTMLAFTDDETTLVVDCGGDVVQRLMASGINLDTIIGLVVTHEHPDHVSGFPLFMEKIWLAGRRKPIAVYGIAPALDQARRCFGTFNTSGWKGMPSIDWREVSHTEGAILLEDDRWRVTASPVVHPAPTIGLRVEHRANGGVAAYSCDTEPTENVVRLAEGADILVHEATGAGPGHTSIEDAAQIAARAKAKKLILVHLPPGLSEQDLKSARASMDEISLGEELGRYSFGPGIR